MVGYVESLNTCINVKAFGYFELAADGGVDIKVAWLAQRVVTGISEGAHRVLSKGCRIDPLEFGFGVTGGGIERCAGYSVGTVQSNAGA